LSQCPKCQYVRTDNDSHALPGVCPSCGIVYAKWISARQADSAPGSSITDDETDLEHEIIEETSLLQKIGELLLDVPDRVDPLVFWGRAFLFVVFVIWGLWFIATNGSWQDIGGSFLHNINLAFHEFGHVLFGPFGRFMGILGGSLFQVMMPLIVMVAFIRQGDNFEAAIMLWWIGQNFIDISPYISDGQYRGLPLIMGMGEDSHDWGNLLTMMNAVESAHTYGKFSFYLGSVIILISLAWAGYILYLQKQKEID
jgi:hypothetical protein